MRFLTSILTSMIALWMTPAQAAKSIDLVIWGVVTGTQDVYNCPGEGQYFSDPDCASYGHPFSERFSFVETFPLEAFDDGVEVLFYGDPYLSGQFLGRINYVGGDRFTGADLIFDRRDPSIDNCRRGSCVGTVEFGSAETFRVVALSGVVPEPSSWIMMLVGFWATGFAMRSRQRAVVRAASLGSGRVRGDGDARC